MFRILSLTTVLLFIGTILTSCQNGDVIELQGYVEGDLTYIASPFSGQLNELLVDRGQAVKAKTLLFNLDPEPQNSDLQQAIQNVNTAQANLINLEKGQRTTVLEGIEAQIKQTEANLNLAKIRLARAEKLFSAHAVSRDYYDQAIAEYQVQVGLLAQLQANLSEAKLGSRNDLIKAQLYTLSAARAALSTAVWAAQQKSQRAPVSGFIYDTYFYQGEFVPASNPVLSILSPENIYIKFYVPEIILGKIKIGQNVQLTCDGCNKSYQAAISYISPIAEYTPPVIYSRTSNYKYVFLVRAKPNLNEAAYFHPGQPVYVTINIGD
ncbi:MAG: HlyD family secretion protein [Gammaproteobacteria bacterium]